MSTGHLADLAVVFAVAVAVALLLGTREQVALAGPFLATGPGKESAA